MGCLPRRPVRERLLAAAEQLFYRESVHQVGIERERLLSVFEVLERNMAEPGYRGCAFARVAVEAAPGNVRTICEQARNWLYRRLLEQAELAGARNPALLARQLQIVYDGASVATAADHASEAGAVAKAVAVLLVAQHLD